jgi:tRNA(Ile)-lysidine synthase
MAPLGPWNEQRRVAVAVSGGADSLCLALLAARWGRPLGLIVDHGLRPESAGEAAATAQQLGALGVPARILQLHDLHRSPGLAARARAARYTALTQAAREAGLLDLLLGHHRSDQAETVLLRRAAKSGDAGLAAMAALSETPSLRLARPLLTIAPGRLRATLRAAGVAWVEDPSNRDPVAHRARLRLLLDDAEGTGAQVAALAAAAADSAARRAAREAEIAAVLAARATIRPEGFAILTPGALPAPALSALIRAIGGAAYPPGRDAVARLAADPRPAVLAGIRLLPAGKLGPGLLMVREAAAMSAPVAAFPGAVWDGRFRLADTARYQPGATVGALGHDAAGLRRISDLPAAILVTLPALRHHGVLAAVPHIGYPAPQSCARMVFSPASPAAGAPFLPPAEGTPGGMPTGLPSPMLRGAARAAG